MADTNNIPSDAPERKFITFITFFAIFYFQMYKTLNAKFNKSKRLSIVIFVIYH